MARLAKHRLLSKHIRYQLLPAHQKFHSSYFSFSVHYPEKEESSRVGFIIRKKIGNAVVRNRLRRILREVFFSFSSQLNRSIWVLMDVKPASRELTPPDFRLEATNLLKKV